MKFLKALISKKNKGIKLNKEGTAVSKKHRKLRQGMMARCLQCMEPMKVYPNKNSRCPHCDFLSRPSLRQEFWSLHPKNIAQQSFLQFLVILIFSALTIFLMYITPGRSKIYAPLVLSPLAIYAWRCVTMLTKHGNLDDNFENWKRETTDLPDSYYEDEPAKPIQCSPEYMNETPPTTNKEKNKNTIFILCSTASTIFMVIMYFIKVGPLTHIHLAPAYTGALTLFTIIITGLIIMLLHALIIGQKRYKPDPSKRPSLNKKKKT